ncbi:D-aminoacyl-tRNA deacylase [Taenia crassiceps]|uniref:D-aminoacyl-tRNA deacylase n=1 Tax=Taenia crassiceps TaxID=6207 RepID=A0ABR4QQC7_9CEST
MIAKRRNTKLLSEFFHSFIVVPLALLSCQVMRVVIQRVKSASVHVDGQLISEIGRGLMVLVGISRDDEDKDVAYLARKIVNLRLFEDEEKQRRWDKSVKDVEGEILCVSQFTLYSLLKGNKLDFHLSMSPDASMALYEAFLSKVRSEYKAPDKVKGGVFGAMMDVSLVNDGPVTITLDSRNSDPPPRSILKMSTIGDNTDAV